MHAMGWDGMILVYSVSPSRTGLCVPHSLNVPAMVYILHMKKKRKKNLR